MIPVVVLTCPRDGAHEYLHQTIGFLEREAEDVDFARQLVSDETDDAVALSVPGWTVTQFMRPAGTLKGNKLAYWRALEVALDVATETGSGEALVFEDDIALCNGALRRMATFPIPRDCDFLMFYAPAVLQGAHSFPGLWRTPTPVMGTQAIKFTRRTLARLLEWKDALDFQKFTASDQALELARILLGMKYAAHCPELVQHVGEKSIDSPGWNLDSHRWRRALTFSPKLDAMALYARDDLYR